MVGLIEAPEPFAISGDSRFAAVRLWPWTWSLFSDTPLDAARGCWLPFDGPIARTLPDFAAVEELLAGAPDRAEMGRAKARAWFSATTSTPSTGSRMRI